MPNLAVMLKQEISRLARKEIRQQVSATQQAGAQHRRDIARLKRLVSGHERKIAFLEGRERERLSKPTSVSHDLLNGARFSTVSVRSQRRKLKLSAEQYGRLLGVSGQTIYLWEQGKSRPRTAQLASLVSLRNIGRRQALRRLDLLTAAAEKEAAAKPRGRQRIVRKPR